MPSGNNVVAKYKKCSLGLLTSDIVGVSFVARNLFCIPKQVKCAFGYL